jgi:uncharacterized protein (DUF305 family)
MHRRVRACAEPEQLGDTTMKKLVLLAVAALALASAVAYAQMQTGPRHNMPMQQGQGPMMGQDHKMGHDMMGHGGMMGMMHAGSSGHRGTHASELKGDSGPSSLAFHGINGNMHEGMDITFTGNADIDFVKGMIPHHQGAVDMAKTVLAFGRDAEVRKLAEEVIKAQETEIAWMKDWLNKNGQ